MRAGCPCRSLLLPEQLQGDPASVFPRNFRLVVAVNKADLLPNQVTQQRLEVSPGPTPTSGISRGGACVGGVGPAASLGRWEWGFVCRTVKAGMYILHRFDLGCGCTLGG